MKTEKARVLFTRGIESTCIIATDNQAVLWDVENQSDDVGEVLGPKFIPENPGIYLFEGEGKWVQVGAPWDVRESELDWSGTVRPVSAEELSCLLEMVPPVENEE